MPLSPSLDGPVKSLQKVWQSKKLQMQGAQILRSEAYLEVRSNDEGCSVTPQMGFLRSHQVFTGG
jgi:hypothetical protein